MASDEMTRPVTRGEMDESLREQSEILRGEMREQTSTILRAVEDRFVIAEQRWDQRFVDLKLELVRQVNAIIQTMQDHLKVVDEPYRDIPARVTRLEEEVFRPKRQRRR